MSKLTILGFVPAIIGAAWIAPKIKSHIEVQDSYTQTEMQAAKDSIALSLMGQLQFTVGDLLWMKSQEYLHGGLTYRMPTRAEEEMGYMPKESTDVVEGLSHSEGILMSPDSERDWRGILGNIDRQIIPYAEHKHADPVELIPWYQLVVKLNPHQERVFSMGAFFMSDSAQAPGDALQFLYQGLDANPWSWEIRGGIGRLLHDYAKNPSILAKIKDKEKLLVDSNIPTTEKESFIMAVKYLKEAAENGLQDRIETAKRRELFDDYQKQLLRETYLMLAKSQTELEQWDDALATCTEGWEVMKHTHFRVQARIIKKNMTELGLEPTADKYNFEKKTSKVHELKREQTLLNKDDFKTKVPPIQKGSKSEL